MKHIFATWDHLERDGNWELGFLRRNKGAWEDMGKSPSLLVKRSQMMTLRGTCISCMFYDPDI